MYSKVGSVAKVVYKPRIDLWRIVDGRSNKPVRTKYNRSLDDGGCRSEIDAYRMLRAFQEKEPTRAEKRVIAKKARLQSQRRLDRIAANVEKRLAKCEPTEDR
jgi:hypothetical protein